MNRKLKPSSTYITNDRPAILGGARMTPFQLPPDFDLTLHRKILASGKVKAATPEDCAREIAILKQKIKDGLD
ncbi:hypothetical protein [Duganella radicis]|uniref:Uncharacterized protein n=1 Tax=Duganella radicis TaxID=551988 RepID=A0A6L6PNU2_9BURK|nr:hypothetical protein [Duganella radicis]MTV40653.1 hypothetical protein [Duganella radicis]